MKNHEIWHRVGVKASPAALYEALTDVKKLAQWWTKATQDEWAVYLLSLKAFLETGKGQPFPTEWQVDHS